MDARRESNTSMSAPTGTGSLVSIVIPSFNRRALLERCLESLPGQTYPSLEIIVVDDGSNDGTSQMLEAFAARHPSTIVRTFRHEASRGANTARNWGIRESHGEIVAFLDSDCIARPDWLERLVRGFDAPDVAAVTGLATDMPPANIFELAYHGTNRVHGAGPAPRLIGCNMAIRRGPLLRFMWDEDRRFQAMLNPHTPDVTVSGGCDEEGLFLLLGAAGYRQLILPDAEVLHEHRYTGRSFFRQAYFGGGSAAHLVYKYRLPPRIDLMPFILMYLSLPLAFVDGRWAVLPTLFFLAAIAALFYNELFRKGKSILRSIISVPLMLLYYQVRLAGYLVEAFKVRIGIRKIQRVNLGEIR